MDSKKGQVIQTVHSEFTPVDEAISRNMQNLFATYGEDKVRSSLKELFSMNSKKKIRKAS